MTDSQESVSPTVEPLAPKKVETEESKHSIRKSIWGQLWKDKLVKYPVPFGRIPNFIGVEEATSRLKELDAFKAAKSIEISPDKPLESARALVLDNGKDLYVACPGLKRGIMKKIDLDSAYDTKLIVSRWGIEHTGKEICINDEVHIDLLVVGSVAVSKDGYRIGKGRGYSDMEFALLKEMKALHDQTVIVTIVHDSQVFDELPKDIFKKYDVPIDYILTPTETIEVNHTLPKPEGIFWNEVTLWQIKTNTALRVLKQKHESEGRDTTLSTYNPKERSYRPPFYKRRFYNGPRPKPLNKRTNNNVAIKKDELVKSKSSVDAPKTAPESIENSKDTEVVKENTEPKTKSKKKKRKSYSYYSLRISNIQRSVRVRDLKNALIEKGIKPRNISWKGSRGFCFLHYSKKSPNNATDEAAAKADDSSDAINNVIELIQELKINPNAQKAFTVKIMEPITRVETVDVTSV